jgi:hypothetical protein
MMSNHAQQSVTRHPPDYATDYAHAWALDLASPELQPTTL